MTLVFNSFKNYLAFQLVAFACEAGPPQIQNVFGTKTNFYTRVMKRPVT